MKEKSLHKFAIPQHWISCSFWVFHIIACMGMKGAAVETTLGSSECFEIIHISEKPPICPDLQPTEVWILNRLFQKKRLDWEKLKGILSYHLKQVFIAEYPEAKMTNKQQTSSLGETFQEVVKRN